MKKIHEITFGARTAKVYRDSNWNEYRVRLYVRGRLDEAADYFTDDKQDAISTAAKMVRQQVVQEKSHE